MSTPGGFHQRRAASPAVDPVSPLAGHRLRAGARGQWATSTWRRPPGAWTWTARRWVGDEGTTGAPRPRRLGLSWSAYHLQYARRPDVTYTRARFLQPVGEPRGTFIPLARSPGPAASVHLPHRRVRRRVEGISLRQRGWVHQAQLHAGGPEAGFETKRFRLALDVRSLLNSSWRQAQFIRLSGARAGGGPALHAGLPAHRVGSASFSSKAGQPCAALPDTEQRTSSASTTSAAWWTRT
jgi:hypothetical protein